jgi:hypothetical protein
MTPPCPHRNFVSHHKDIRQSNGLFFTMVTPTEHPHFGTTHPGRYSLVTKTAAKADYLLREADLGGQPDSLRFIEK